MTTLYNPVVLSSALLTALVFGLVLLTLMNESSIDAIGRCIRRSRLLRDGRRHDRR